MPDTPRRSDPVDPGILFSEAAAQRIAHAVRWVEANVRNRAQPQPRGNRPSNTEVFQARCTSGTLDAAGYYPAVITRYDPVATSWTDFATIHLAPLNSETLVSGTRYGVKPIGPASDGTPVYQVLGGSGGGGGGTSVLTWGVDYTQFTGFGAVNSATITLQSPMTANYTTLAGGYAINTANAFTGGSIASSAAFLKIGSNSAPSGYQWTTRPLPDSFVQSFFFCGNFFGSTADNVTLQLTLTGDTLNHLTAGHATVFLVYGAF